MTKNEHENYSSKMSLISPRGQWVKGDVTYLTSNTIVALVGSSQRSSINKMAAILFWPQCVKIGLIKEKGMVDETDKKVVWVKFC